MSNFANDFAKDKEENARASSDWYKFKDGENKMRIMQTPVKFLEMFDNAKKAYFQLWHDCGLKGGIKYLTRAWVIETTKNPATGEEQSTGSMVLVKLPFSVMEQIVDYMIDDYDWKDGTFPMSHLINIKTANAGTKDVKYNVILSPKKTDYPVEALQALEGQTPLEEILEKMKEKSRAKWEAFEGTAKTSKEELPTVNYDEVEYPGEDINPDDIPF